MSVKAKERKETLMRILVCIISGLVLGIWKGLIQVLAIIHFVYVLITGKRIKGLANFCEIWNTQVYRYVRYMTFVANERVFPFAKLGKNISRFGR